MLDPNGQFFLVHRHANNHGRPTQKSEGTGCNSRYRADVLIPSRNERSFLTIAAVLELLGVNALVGAELSKTEKHISGQLANIGRCKTWVSTQVACVSPDFPVPNHCIPSTAEN